jgi:hypothetical protein
MTQIRNPGELRVNQYSLIGKKTQYQIHILESQEWLNLNKVCGIIQV